MDKDQKYTIGYSFKNKMGISANNFVLLELIKDGSIMYTRKLQATEATTFDYTAPATGEYTWRMRSSSIGTTTKQPITYSLDNLSIFYTYPYTIENCDNLADGYRFGFNTQEKDDEVYGAGNLNTAMFWEYDTRIGRRWNTDPRPNKSISPYATFANNPISLCDVNGDSSVFSNTGDKIHYDPNDKDLRVFMQEGKNLTLIGEFGKTVDVSKILTNVINRNIEEAKKMDGGDWFMKIRPGGEWDYKANESTIFGISWSIHNEKNTLFKFNTRNFGSKTFEDASDIGNYHAGITGRMTYQGEGLSYNALWNAAGYGETIKDILNFNDVRRQIRDLNMPMELQFIRSMLIGNSPRNNTYGDEVDDFYWNTSGMKDADKLKSKVKNGRGSWFSTAEQ